MIQTTSKGLSNFKRNISWKQQSNKLFFKFFRDTIEFVDTVVYQNENNKKQSTLFQTQTNQQN